MNVIDLFKINLYEKKWEHEKNSILYLKFSLTRSVWPEPESRRRPGGDTALQWNEKINKLGNGASEVPVMPLKELITIIANSLIRISALANTNENTSNSTRKYIYVYRLNLFTLKINIYVKELCLCIWVQTSHVNFFYVNAVQCHDFLSIKWTFL